MGSTGAIVMDQERKTIVKDGEFFHGFSDLSEVYKAAGVSEDDIKIRYSLRDQLHLILVDRLPNGTPYKDIKLTSLSFRSQYLAAFMTHGIGLYFGGREYKGCEKKDSEIKD